MLRLHDRTMLLNNALVFVTTLATAAAVRADARYVGPIGLDIGACRHEHAPCATLAYAVSKASAGDTIRIKGNASGVAVLNSPLNSVVNVVLDRDLNIIAEHDATPVFDAGGAGRHFDILPGVTVAMRGLTLVNGDAPIGGSIRNRGELTLSNCVLSDNESSERGGAVWNGGTLNVVATAFNRNLARTRGGAISNEQGSTLTIEGGSRLATNSALEVGGALFLGEGSVSAEITDSTLEGNVADQGGGVYAEGGSFSVTGSTFQDNTGYQGGGAIRSSIPITLDTTRVDDNKGEQGAGLLLLSEGASRLVECSFHHNIADWDGGAISIHHGQLWASQCSFSANEAPVGGAVTRLIDATYSIVQSYFLQNLASESGGAIAEVTVSSQGTSYVGNTTFELNSASGAVGVEGRGGALFRATPSTATLVNCTFSSNSASGRGGTLYADDSGAVLQLGNVTIHGSSAPEGGAIYAEQAFEVRNSIIHDSADDDGRACAGVALTGLGNVVGIALETEAELDDSCGDATFAAAGPFGLDPVLAENGGQTAGVDAEPMRTHALLEDNAIAGKGIGDCVLTSTPLARDQRGETRPGGDNTCDVGAFEAQ